MVRNLVGTFVQAGAHRLSPDSIPTLLAARDRASAGPTAPASGLFLVSVDYPAPESCQDPLSSEFSRKRQNIIDLKVKIVGITVSLHPV